MKKSFRKLLYLTTILAVLLMSAMPSYAVYADGGAEGDSPAEEPPVTEPANPPAEDPPVTEPADFPAEEPPITEPADPPAEEPPVPAAAEPAEKTPAEEGDPAEPPLTEEAPAEEPASLPEILEQVPEGTDLVVVNKEGNPEPLASEAAAEILIKGDPIWCPAGMAPDPTNPNCTSSHTGFDDLLADLTGGTYSGDGVIWVESTYDANEDSGDIRFLGTSGNLSNLGAITVLGGWDGIAGSTSIDPTNPSVLDDRLWFENWTSDISISNLDMNAPQRNPLLINTDGDITVNNVSVSGSTGNSGLYLDNCDVLSGPCTMSGDVTVTNSEFNNNNNATGLVIHSTGVVTIENVTADGNARNGIRVYAHDEAGSEVNIKDTIATNNAEAGIEIGNVGGDITLKGVTASNNGVEGITTSNIQGDITGSNITANENINDGISIQTTRGNVCLSNITANESLISDGIDLENIDGNVTLSSVTANLNSQSGIEITNVDGSTNLYCVTTNENVNFDGIFIQTDNGVVLKCSQSNNNGGDGVQINLAPTAQLLSFTATGNGLLDINYDPLVTTVTEKQVDCSEKTTKSKSKSKSKPDLDDGLFTKLYCLPGEIKVALYDTYGDKIEFDNLCGYEAGVFDPDSWAYPDTIPGGGDDYITSLQNKMLEEIPNLELNTEYGLPGVLAQVLDELPFMLPDEFSYASAFFTAVLDEGEYLDPLPEESGLTVRFRVPDWLDPDEALTILWWDGADWVNLGGEFSEDGYYFQVTTEETGVFVLATFEAES